MSDTLIKRLRCPIRRGGTTSEDSYEVFDELQLEAADRIAALETQLRDRDEQIAKARDALEPFGDVDGEGDEDYPDDMKVTVTFGRCTFHALRLGDFRRARAALSTTPDALDAERRRVEALERALGHISRCEDNMGNHKLARTALKDQTHDR